MKIENVRTMIASIALAALCSTTFVTSAVAPAATGPITIAANVVPVGPSFG